jgi:hypothetical protein
VKRKEYPRSFLLMAMVVLVAGACETTSTKDNHTRLVVSPDARRVVEASQQAGAEGEDAAATKPDMAAARNPDQVICRKEPPPSGTRLGARRICATRAEWDELADSGKEETKRIQDAAKHCIPSTFRPC